MPGPINNNTNVLASRIANEAKASGLSSADVQQLGQTLIAKLQGTPDLQLLPSVRDGMAAMSSALLMAANELAANTAPDPFVDGGVTA